MSKTPSRETLRALETTPSMFLILSPDLYILTASDPYLKAVESERESIQGRHIFEAFPANPEFPEADGVENINASLQAVLRTKQPHYMKMQKYDVPDRNNPGKFIERYWDPSHTAVLDECGEIEYIIQWATDVTEKVKAEHALAESKVREQQSLDKLQSLNEELLASNEELYAANKELLLVQQSYRELTEELEARIDKRIDALAESEMRFRTMAESAKGFIALSDENANAVYFNKAWTELTGRKTKELLEYGWIDLLHPDDRGPWVDFSLSSFKRRNPFSGEFRLLDKNGKYRWLFANVSPRYLSEGTFAGFVATCMDITERKQDDQRKNDFIAMVSHELKTPLTTLKAYLQVLLRKAKDPFAGGILEKADGQIKKMTGLINGFLNISRLESGKINIEKQEFDMADLIKQVEEETVSTFTNHKVVFAPVDQTIVDADRDKIGQVIDNFISNAVKYSPAGSTIQVVCVKDNNTARVAVIDEGMGVKPEHREKLFDRFYRVESDKTHNIGGFGIGLYLCAEIIQRLEGKIWVESEAGKGSSFYFSLPLAKV